MNGDTFGFVVLPDMMQVSNPILILAFIPIFDYVVYPILSIVKKKN
jgi:solute carrier family 15 oligopeptide transporter 1